MLKGRFVICSAVLMLMHLTMCFSTMARVIYSNPKPPFELNTTDSSLTIDVASDNSNTWDNLVLLLDYTTNWSGAYAGDQDFFGCYVRPAVNGSGEIIKLGVNEPIDSSLIYSNISDYPLFYYFPDGIGQFQNQNGYVGLRLTNGSDTYYGWVLVETSNCDNPNAKLVIRDWAYENAPGQGILAGEGANLWQAGNDFWDDANNWSAGFIPVTSSSAYIYNDGEVVVRPIYEPNSARLYATDDTFVKNNYPTQTNGDLDYFECRDYGSLNIHHHGYVKFHLSSIHDRARISNVTLRLRIKGKGFCVLPETDTFHIYEVDSDLWSEQTLNWGNKPGFGDQVFSAGLPDGLPMIDEWFEVSIPVEIISESITSDDMVSFGFSTHSSCSDSGSNTAVQFYSSETAYSPQLLIDYTEPTGEAEVGYMFLGYTSNSSGNMNISDPEGKITIGNEGKDACGLIEGEEGERGEFHVGYEGSGMVTQDNGKVSVFGLLSLDSERGYGTYELSDGQLNVSGYVGSFVEDPMDPECGGMWQFNPGFLRIGEWGYGVFNHSGGKVSMGDLPEVPDLNLEIATEAGSMGEYNLSGTGELFTHNVSFGHGSGIFRQSGGVHKTNRLSISGGSATYLVSGGSLQADVLSIGYGGETGTFEIQDSLVDIQLKRFNLYSGVTFKAVPNVRINLVEHGSTTNDGFKVGITDPNTVSGLGNTEMFFESDDYMEFEVAGEDIGATHLGFNKNFALGTLRIGDVNTGQVKLIDSYDNQPDSTEAEALYVTNLILGSGSTLDLNGLNLYYSYFTDMGGTVTTNGGNLTQITSFAPGDFSENNQVDLFDYAIFGNAWHSQPGDDNWNDKCNISEPADNVIDEKDLAKFCENWLFGK